MGKGPCRICGADMGIGTDTSGRLKLFCPNDNNHYNPVFSEVNGEIREVSHPPKLTYRRDTPKRDSAVCRLCGADKGGHTYMLHEFVA